MPKRRGFVVVAVVAVAAVLVATTVAFADDAGPPKRIVSSEGGFSLRVPEGWSVEHRHPTDTAHTEYLVGQDATLGVVHRSGFWVAKWPVPDTTSVADIQHRMRTESPGERRNRSVGVTTLAGRPGAIVGYDEEVVRIGGVNYGTKKTVMREIVVDGFEYQVGTWVIGAPGQARAELNRIAASFDLL